MLSRVEADVFLQRSFNLDSRRKRTPNPFFAAISAQGYFEQATQISTPASGLDFRVYYTPPKFADGTVIVCHHGAGYSGLSFACFAKELSRISKGECGVMSIDCRGHGEHHCYRIGLSLD